MLSEVSLRLGDCEKAIEQGLQSVGFQLQMIRDERLYRDGFATFEDYCLDRWGMRRNYVNKQIRAAATIAELELGTNGTQTPTHERQVRPLTELQPDAKIAAWERAVQIADGGRVTERIVRQAVNDVVHVDQIIPPRRTQSSDHPATFSNDIVDVMVDVCGQPEFDTWRILDPFAGTGLVHEIAERVGCDSVGVEIEEEWAAMHDRTIHGDSRTLTRTMVGKYGTVVTSPTYGNRMADSHDAQDLSDRATYRHRLGRPLTEGNSGGMQWGDEYRALHAEVYERAVSYLDGCGLFVLNVKDHVRDGRRVPVAAWHLRTLLGLGLEFVDDRSLPSRGLGGAVGDNRESRIGIEHIYVLQKGRNG